ncbi:MAG: hypothetical protein M3R16_12215 [Pseudomonadota bacterium]|nr:hypothetical protein [Pseudomonadota bacterium]
MNETSIDLANLGAVVGPLNLSWESPHPTRGDSPADVFDKRISQAEALSKVLVCENFLTFNDAIQNNTLWLLSDLITEARIAAHEMREAQRARTA